MKVNQKGFSAAVILVLILLILGVGAGAYYFGKSNASVPLSPPLPPPSPSANPTITSKITPTSMLTSTPTPTVNPNSNVFTSQNLGVTFNYTAIKSVGINDLIKVKQVGNKVYVYSDIGAPEDGQYLEMFSKDKNQSLVDAIKQKFLTGYSLNDCIAEIAQNPVGGQSYPAGYEIAKITVPGATIDLDDLLKKASKCPEKYVTTNGISYFLTDTNHPDKFIYLSIGQYPIKSGINDKNWETTIKFLP